MDMSQDIESNNPIRDPSAQQPKASSLTRPSLNTLKTTLMMTKQTSARAHLLRPRSRSTASTDDDWNNRRMVVWLRVLLIAALTCCAVVVSCWIYFYTSNELQRQFERDFESSAQKLLESVGKTFDSTMAAADAYAFRLVSAAASTPGVEWPFVTLPDLAVQSAKMLSLVDSIYVAFYPLITKEQRPAWENFTKHNHEWVEQSLNVQSKNPNFHGPILKNYSTSNVIWKNEGPVDPDEEGPFLPSWMGSPVIPYYPPYNWNALAYSAFSDSLRFALESKTVVFTSVANHATNMSDDVAVMQAKVTNDWAIPYLDDDEDPAEPFSDMYYPIIADVNNVFVNQAPPDVNASGIVAFSFYWRHAFKTILPPNQGNQLVLVVQNPCGGNQSFTYLIDGKTPIFLGYGDLHDPVFNPMRVGSRLNELSNADSSYTGLKMNDDFCPFTLNIYPSMSMTTQHINDGPTLYTCVAALIFVLTSALFLSYDFAVRREVDAKQRLLHAKRHFMRFVSHEVRTPLNAVCLGLSLLQDEISQAVQASKGNAVHSEREEHSNLLERLEEQPEPNAPEDVALRNGAGFKDDDIAKERYLEEWLILAREIYMSAESSVEVLNDLLNYDKIQMGNFTMEYTLFPVFGLIQETSREFRLSANNKKVRFELDNQLQPDDCGKDIDDFKVVGDRIRLAQVLRNLVSNALKFTPAEGQLTIRASMIAATTNIKDKHTLKTGKQISLKRFGTVSIDVIDTGVGLSESQLERLFCDGTQFNVNELQSGQGSGLGLFISKGMVLQHGGDLQASSMGLGYGSTFTLELPLYVVPDEPEQATVASTDTANMDETTKDCHLSSVSVGLAQECSVADAAQPTQPSHFQLETTPAVNLVSSARAISSLRILVVDDVASNRKLIARMAINRNHVVDQAENGREAVNRVVESMENGLPYDTILMDSQMPIMTGPDAVKEMRQLGCESFIVGITGNVLTEDICHFLSCGADDVLGKPVNFLKLEELWLQHGIAGGAPEEPAKAEHDDFSV